MRKHVNGKGGLIGGVGREGGVFNTLILLPEVHVPAGKGGRMGWEGWGRRRVTGGGGCVCNSLPEVHVPAGMVDAAPVSVELLEAVAPHLVEELDAAPGDLFALAQTAARVLLLAVTQHELL